jgi:hypothetical protein
MIITENIIKDDDKVFIVVCKECGGWAFSAWYPGLKMTDVKFPCERCGGTDWEDRETPLGKKIEEIALAAGMFYEKVWT